MMPIPTDSDPKLCLAPVHEVEQAGGSASPNDTFDKMAAYFPN